MFVKNTDKILSFAEKIAWKQFTTHSFAVQKR